MGEDDALENLADNVESFLRSKVTKKAAVKPDREEAYQKVLKLVREREHYRAATSIDNFLKLYPEDAEGYWLKLINRCKCTPSTISKLKANLFEEPEYSKAIQYADENQKREFLDIAKTCNNNLEQQKEFDRLLENESIKYVNEFSKETPEGRDILGIKEKATTIAKKVESYNYILRYTFAAGVFLYFLGNLISVFILNSLNRKGILLSASVGLPLIILGVAIMLSYNWIVDIIATIAVIVFSVLSAYNTNAAPFFRIIAIIIPAIAYMATNNSYYLNRLKNKMLHVTVDLQKTLNELKHITDKASTKLSQFASDLLKEFKKNRLIDNNVIEIHDDDYFKAQTKIKEIYKDEAKKYDALINMSIPTENGSKVKRTDSALGLIALIFSFIPALNIIGVGIALYDILADKHRQNTHVGSIASLLLDMFVIACLYIMLMAI